MFKHFILLVGIIYKSDINNSFEIHLKLYRSLCIYFPTLYKFINSDEAISDWYTLGIHLIIVSVKNHQCPT